MDFQKMPHNPLLEKAIQKADRKILRSERLFLVTQIIEEDIIPEIDDNPELVQKLEDYVGAIQQKALVYELNQDLSEEELAEKIEPYQSSIISISEFLHENHPLIHQFIEEQDAEIREDFRTLN